MRIVAGIAICLSVMTCPLDAAIVTFSTSQSPFDFGGYNQGWWSNSIGATDSNSNYIVGWGTYRNFFTFNLSSLGASDTITSATLKLRRGDSASTDGTETIGFFDVATSPSVLNHNSGFNSAVYSDLGSGTSYGAFVVASTGAPNDILSFTLNAAALAALNASKGQFFSIGGTLLTDDGNDYIFGATGGHLNPHDLVLDIQPTAESVPEPATCVIWGLGAMGCAIAAYKRRGSTRLQARNTCEDQRS